jgi:hypothetical protein
MILFSVMMSPRRVLKNAAGSLLWGDFLRTNHLPCGKFQAACKAFCEGWLNGRTNDIVQPTFTSYSAAVQTTFIQNCALKKSVRFSRKPVV